MTWNTCLAKRREKKECRIFADFREKWLKPLELFFCLNNYNYYSSVVQLLTPLFLFFFLTFHLLKSPTWFLTLLFFATSLFVFFFFFRALVSLMLAEMLPFFLFFFFWRVAVLTSRTLPLGRERGIDFLPGRSTVASILGAAEAGGACSSLYIYNNIIRRHKLLIMCFCIVVCIHACVCVCVCL